MALAVDQKARSDRRLRLGRARLPIAVSVGSFLVFGLIQIALTYHYMGRQRGFCIQHAGQSWMDPWCRAFQHRSRIPAWLRSPNVEWLGWSLVRFTALAAVTVAVAAWGRRWVFWIPVTLWAVLPSVVGLGPDFGSGYSWPPNTVGTPWPRSVTWVGIGVELILVSLPALAVAMWARERGDSRLDQRLAVGSFALCVGIFVLWQSTFATISGDATTTWTFDLVRVLPLFALGALLGLSRRTSWVLVVAAALYCLWWYTNVVFGDSLTVATVVPFASAALLGAAWLPLAAGLQQLEDRPWTLFWIANGLNVADAVVTWAFLRTGQVEEANPIVRGIGLPAKVILVGMLTWLLLRTRPRALVWPILILAFVMAWDVAGIVLGHAMGVG